MERVTNVFCGGASSAAAAAAPEKPSRLPPPASRRPPPRRRQPAAPTHQHQAPTTWDQLVHDERFLARFFMYFTAAERCVLAQVRVLCYV